MLMKKLLILSFICIAASAKFDKEMLLAKKIDKIRKNAAMIRAEIQRQQVRSRPRGVDAALANTTGAPIFVFGQSGPDGFYFNSEEHRR